MFIHGDCTSTPSNRLVETATGPSSAPGGGRPPDTWARLPSTTPPRCASSEWPLGPGRLCASHPGPHRRPGAQGQPRGDQQEVLAQEAPHILGVTVAEHADRPGDFTQILYFTSEQDARLFEQEPPVDADEPAEEERRGLMTNLRSFDLREPQMLVPPVVVTY